MTRTNPTDLRLLAFTLAAATLSGACNAQSDPARPSETRGTHGASQPAANQDGRPHGAPSQPVEILDWQKLEAGSLADHVQLTSPERFLKAGEQYFDPQGRWIIFQAVARPAPGAQPAPHYSMYIAKLRRADDGRITGIEEPQLISEPDSWNSCGYFHPREPWRVIFGSTIRPPSGVASGGYQRGTNRYMWLMPRETEVVTLVVPQIYHDYRGPQISEEVLWTHEQVHSRPVFEHDGYDAECAYSPDGRHIVYCSAEPDSFKPDLFVFDTQTGRSTPLVTAEGYDGGPFFSPNGRRICYRSDRTGNDLLQLFVADLVFDSSGAITGITNEVQLTDNEHVNWAPFWHPSGEFLVYATSEVGHHNYEVFSIEVPPAGVPAGKSADLRKRRITHATGFDGLPVFSTDGQWMMWCSQRGPKIEGEERPSSQVWAARVINLAP